MKSRGTDLERVFLIAFFINLFYDILSLVSSVGRRGVVCYGRVWGRVVVELFVYRIRGWRGLWRGWLCGLRQVM